MTLWEQFCEEFGGRPVRYITRENGELVEIEAQSMRRFRLVMPMVVTQAAFELDPEGTVEAMIAEIEQVAKNTGEDMREKLEKMRSAGQKNGVT